MTKPLITILTAAYDRADTIPALYKSLLQQNNFNFEWLIVDDGSKDETKEIIHKYQENTTKFKIRYVFEHNKGKHFALNLGIKNISTELTFIVDSDDTITSNAIDIVEKTFYSQKNLSRICAFSFLRADHNGSILSNKKFPYDGYVTTYLKSRELMGITGDTAEVFITKVLKKYPFPEFKNEKFLSEDIVWGEMSKQYNMIFYNKIICIGGYLSNGLTKNRRKNNWNSPNGCMLRGKLLLESPIVSKRRKFKWGLFYDVYGLKAGYSSVQLVRVNKSIYTISMMLPAKILFIKWKMNFG
ncbi:glycosyltransferase family 2 protein [Lactobacillus amylovorus]|uniref:glycosyltransferase family 2 protein n=1 Tax=Lactobacillus amylovorus TaxID=1604 RepID=UPI00232B50BE|nr:glycosyltransferase family A protein [Lactobacillus amylovorus]MDB6249205.1 glycosyltransferase family 2 protein [Lactobacillus amylovorus]